MLTSDWTLVAAMLLLPLAAFALLEVAGLRRRRRERARAHRSKRRASVHQLTDSATG